MTFRIHLLFASISLYILLGYDTNARTLEWPELVLTRKKGVSVESFEPLIDSVFYPMTVKQPQSLGFSWENCGPATDAVKILALSIGPDPIRLPGNVIISTSVNITRPFPAEVSAKVDMETKVAGFWIKIPCERDVGSCSYSVCTNKTEVYPALFENYNAERKCPAIPPATYSVSNLIMNIQKSIPSIAQGEFRVNVDLNSNDAGHLGCLHLDANLKS